MQSKVPAIPKEAHSIERPPSLAPLSPFSIAWALSIVIHISNFPHWLDTLAGNAYLVSAFFLLAKPSSAHRLATALFFEVLVIFNHLPLVANHLYFVLISDLTLLTIYAFDRRRPDLSSNLLRSGLPAILLTQICLYLFAGFHKLNHDYFLPDASSAVYFYEKIRSDIPLPPLGIRAQHFVIYSSIFIEFLIPLLLFFRKSRPSGILVGMAFHLFLSVQKFYGQHGLAAFSVTMFSIYIFYEPQRWRHIFTTLASLAKRLPLLRNQQLHPATKTTAFIIFALAFLFVYRLLTNGESNHSFLRRSLHLFWLLLGLTYLVSYSISLIHPKFFSIDHSPPQPSSLTRIHPSTLLPPLAIFILGASPYLGLGTKGTFSMFSNLRVETPRTNHLLIPAGFRIFSLNRDLIRVISSSDLRLQSFADRGLLVHSFEIRRLAQSSGKDFQLTIRESGEDLLISHILTPDHHLLQPLNPIAGKLVRFRPVDPESRPSSCQH